MVMPAKWLAAATGMFLVWRLLATGRLDNHRDPWIVGPGYTIIALFFACVIVLVLVAPSSGVLRVVFEHAWARFSVDIATAFTSITGS